jgi:hypothetical protein
MDTDLHHCVLAGVLERAPITRFADHGTQMTGFTLKLTEPGPTGQAFRLFVPVESYSQGAEQAGDLSAGASVLVAGHLIKVLTPASVITDDHDEETPPLSRSGAWKPHHRDGWR